MQNIINVPTKEQKDSVVNLLRTIIDLKQARENKDDLEIVRNTINDYLESEKGKEVVEMFDKAKEILGKITVAIKQEGFNSYSISSLSGRDFKTMIVPSSEESQYEKKEECEKMRSLTNTIKADISLAETVEELKTIKESILDIL